MPQINLKHAVGFMLLAAPMLCSGCGSSATDVSGRVTYKGKPLASGSVTFFCKNKQIASALIGADGTYRLKEVPLGPAQVTVRSHAKVPEGLIIAHKLPPSKDAPRPAVANLAFADFLHVPIPERFNHPEESGLAFVISATQTVFNIDLKP